MTVQGSTIAAVKAALIAHLIPRTDCADVVITYAGPRKATDLRNDLGDYEAIWLGDADSNENVVVFKDGPQWWDETYQFDVTVQVIRRGGSAAQDEADTRAVQLLGAVLGTLATDPTLGLRQEEGDFRRVEAIPIRWRHVTGHLDPSGVGSRFEIRVSVEGRVAIT